MSHLSAMLSLDVKSSLLMIEVRENVSHMEVYVFVQNWDDLAVF